MEAGLVVGFLSGVLVVWTVSGVKSYIDEAKKEGIRAWRREYEPGVLMLGDKVKDLEKRMSGVEGLEKRVLELEMEKVSYEINSDVKSDELNKL